MRILFIGDVVGKPGREILTDALPVLVTHYGISLVVANVENSAGGNGVTKNVAEQIKAAGVDVMTSGNHIWDKKEALDYIQNEPRLIRPANYPDAPGRGHYVAHCADGVPVGIINIMGRVFMNPLDNPFDVIHREIQQVRQEASIILVDIHAEATSEKLAMGWHLDGEVTAVVGTHTHVQTADERVLPNGTAYVTDVGMTGPHDSIIGVEIEPALRRFVNGMPSRFDTASHDPRLNGVVISVAPDTGLAASITRVSVSPDDIKALRSAPVATTT